MSGKMQIFYFTCAACIDDEKTARRTQVTREKVAMLCSLSATFNSACHPHSRIVQESYGPQSLHGELESTVP